MAYSTQYEAVARAAGWTIHGGLFANQKRNEIYGPMRLDWADLCAAAGVEIDHGALLRRFSNTAQEFPDFDLASLPEIPESWKDASWHNEQCPGFNPFGTVYVFVDYPNAADREFPECEERFSVIDHAGGVVSHYNGNDWNAVLDAVEGLEKRHLGAEYKSLIGYDPFEDCPDIAVAEVRQTLKEYKEILLDPNKANIRRECAAVVAPIEAAGMDDIHRKIRLARVFGSNVQEELSSAQFRECCSRNKAEEHESVCHSHDFTDANMLMLAAFNEVEKREFEADNPAHLKLWNDAWAIAKAAEFFA